MWTKWMKLTDLEYKYNYGDIHKHFYCDSPAVYELAVAGSRMGNLEIVYVGMTNNFKRRINEHSSERSNISKEIKQACKDGKTIYCRFTKRASINKVVELEKRFLSNYKYEWNIVGNKKII